MYVYLPIEKRVRTRVNLKEGTAETCYITCFRRFTPWVVVPCPEDMIQKALKVFYGEEGTSI